MQAFHSCAGSVVVIVCSVLLSQAAAAYKKLCQDEKFIRSLFVKTGSLITATGAFDSLISPQGTKEYKVPAGT